MMRRRPGGVARGCIIWWPMNAIVNVPLSPDGGEFSRRDSLLSALVFLVACAVLGWFANARVESMMQPDWATLLFFISYALFVVSMGYPEPGYGQVAFDRMAQVASILVLGPVHAAWINGAVLLLHPWYAMRQDALRSDVLATSLSTSGLTMLLIVGCGALYEWLGGTVPLRAFDTDSAPLVLTLLLSMQLLTDAGRFSIAAWRRWDPFRSVNLYPTLVELVSGLAAVFIAIVFVRMNPAEFILLLIVSSFGMLALKRYGEMRGRLEYLVQQRTEELKKRSLELERQATHDKLTGLVNRRYVEDFLERQLESSKRHGRRFAVALADIDHFKSINDEFSHATGDAVLRHVAKIMASRCRRSDVVARYGGEEFLLCFPETSALAAEHICDDIRHAVEQADWAFMRERVGDDFRATVSFGVSEAGRESRHAGLLAEADLRLYAAKRAGRNRVVAED